MPPAVVGVEHTCCQCLLPRRAYELDETGTCQACERWAKRSDRPPPPFATSHVPGSLGKVIVMEWRDENGYALYHPADARGCVPIESNEGCRVNRDSERAPRRCLAAG